MSRVFPKTAMLEAEQLTLPEILWQRPQVYGITIDGETSRDLDDAIWLEPTPTGATLWVHIADVSTVIRPGTSLDQAAIARTQTDYHRQGTAPMFPRCLSEHLLSLLGQQRRPTLTVEIQLDPTAQILDTQIFESWIATDRQLSYATADAILADPTHLDWPLLQNCQLWSERIYRRRLADSLTNTVDLPEGSWLDENGMVIDSDLTRYHSHLIIQEFMIIANTAIAQWLDQRQIPALYRNHTSKDLVTLVGDVEVTVGAPFDPAEQRRQIACALNRAEYAADRQGHFALNLEAYCHFTSPIRRLADLINHRLVKAWLHQRPYPYNREKLRELAAHINQMAVAREEVTKTFFKTRHHRLYQTQLQTPDLWAALSQKDFSRLLRYAVETEQFESLVPEVQPRLQQADLTLEDCFVLFFLNQDPQLRQQILDRLIHAPHDAASIIAIADNQLESCQGFRYVEVSQGIYFAAWLEVDLVHGLLTTPHPAISTRKAHARHCACVDWLQGFMAENLVHPSIRVDPDWPSPLPVQDFEGQAAVGVDGELEAQLLGQNAIGVLNEIVQQLGVSPPTYAFVPVANGFCCQADLDLLSEQLTGQGVAINKRVAKCLAAEQVLVALEVAQYVAWEV
jgi:ribonuclease R